MDAEEYRTLITNNAYEVMDATVAALIDAAKALEAGDLAEYLRQTERAEGCCAAAKHDGHLLAKLQKG